MISLPPLNALRAFDVAGRHLNFRAAANEMGVTQGAVAQQVRLLESQLGLPLFQRLPKGLALTAAGRGYHARVAAAFEDLRAATRILQPQPDQVLVSVTPTFAAKWLIPNLPDFSAAHPEIDLRILAIEKVSSFHGDGIDLAIRQTQQPFGASLDATRLFRQQIVAVASPRLVQGKSLPVTGAELARLPKLHDAHDHWPAFLKLMQVESQNEHGLRLSQTALAIDAALSGQGVALVARFLVARELAAGSLVVVTPTQMDGVQEFYLIADKRAKRSSAVSAAYDWFLTKSEAGI